MRNEKWETMRIQKPTKLPKRNMSCRGVQRIERAVEQTAAKFDVSKSFVIAVALAEYFNIKEQERYND